LPQTTCPSYERKTSSRLPSPSSRERPLPVGAEKHGAQVPERKTTLRSEYGFFTPGQQTDAQGRQKVKLNTPNFVYNKQY
jgi:hypothetical protein